MVDPDGVLSGLDLAALEGLTHSERVAFLGSLTSAELDSFEVGLKGPPPVSLRQHLEEVDPGPHLDWWHVGAMMEAGQAVLDGEIRFLMLHMPRRYYKSRTIAQGLTSCFIRNNSDDFAALLFASDELARQHSTYAREMVEKAGMDLRADTKSKSLWRIAGHHGGMWISTTHGFKVGQGWRLGVGDDPMTSYEAAASVAEQRIAEHAIDSFRGSAEKGLPLPALVLMHQRLGPKDPAGRFYARELDAAKELGWTVLDFPAERRIRRKPYPPSCRVWPDPRKMGEPLCSALEGLEAIRKRQGEDPARAAAMDGQEPLDQAGGGKFMASWLKIIGTGREDLDDPVACLAAMAAEGLISKPRRWIRGHDPNAGGADALASVLLCQLEPGAGVEWVWCDPTEDHPPLARVEATMMANARRQNLTAGSGAFKFVEQAIPKEPATGAVFSASLQASLRAEKFQIHLLPVHSGKVALATPHAAAAAPSCMLCGCLVVADHEREGVAGSDLCKCEEPDVLPGKVAVLAGPLADRFVEVHADFDGEEGGDDDLVDCASAAFNAGQQVVGSLGPPMLV